MNEHVLHVVPAQHLVDVQAHVHAGTFISANLRGAPPSLSPSLVPAANYVASSSAAGEQGSPRADAAGQRAAYGASCVFAAAAGRGA